MVRFSPGRNLAAGRLILLVFLSAALICLCFGWGPQTPGRVALNCLGIILAGTGVLAVTRGFFTEFTYVIEEADGARGGYQLTVETAIGKRSGVPCRISLDGAVIGAEPVPLKKYRYYPLCSGLKKTVIVPPESRGEYAVVIAADGEFRRALIAFGAEEK